MATPNPSASHNAQQYLRTRVMTATPEQLQLMLYDGAVRFTEAAKAAVDRRDLEAVHFNVSKAQAIITELLTGLRPAHGADLCGRLAGVYQFVYRKLIEVGFDHRADSAEAALIALRHQRDSWILLLEKMGQEKAAGRKRGVAMHASAAPVGLSIAA